MTLKVYSLKVDIYIIWVSAETIRPVAQIICFVCTIGSSRIDSRGMNENWEEQQGPDKA